MVLIIVDRNKIIDILQISNEALKGIIKRKTLEKRLEEKGYKLIRQIKNGRKIFYELDIINNTKENFNNLTYALFNTKKDNEFGDYLLYRSNNIDLPITNEMLKNFCNVSKTTINKWNKKMIEHGLMSKDGYFYIAKDYNKDGQLIRYRLTDKYEYQSYHKCSKYAKKKNEIGERYKKEEITFDEMEIMLSGINEYAKLTEQKFIYRVNKYNMNLEENILLMQLIELSKTNNIIKNKEYRQIWLENKLK